MSKKTGVLGLILLMIFGIFMPSMMGLDVAAFVMANWWLYAIGLFVVFMLFYPRRKML